MINPVSFPPIDSTVDDRSSTSRRSWALRTLALLAVFALLLPFPFNDDNAHWHSMAYDFLAFGRWPYLGTWDQSWPGDLLVHIPPILLFGPGDLGFQIFDGLVQFAFSFVLYKLWRLYFSDRTAWMAVLFYAFYYVRCDPFVGGKRDAYASVLVCAGAYLLLRFESREHPLRHVVFGGLTIGFAMLLRPTYGAYLLPLVIFIPALRSHRALATLAWSAMLPLALSYLIYSTKPGGLEEYWRATVLFNRDLYVTIARPFKDFLLRLISPKLLAVPVAIFLLQLIVKRVERVIHNIPKQVVWLYLSFLLLSLLLVLIQRKYYAYHFAMYGLLLTPLAAIGMEWLLRYLPTRIRMPLFFVTFLILSLPLEMLGRYFIPVVGHGDLRKGLITTYRAAVWEDSSEAGVMDYFLRPEHRAGRVEVCSFDPRLRIHLHREPAGIYASLHPIGFRTDPSNPNAFTSYQLVWRRAYLDSLTKLEPRYIVMARATSAEYLTDPYTNTLRTIPGFDSLLHTRYRLDTVIGTDEIYRLNR